MEMHGYIHASCVGWGWESLSPFLSLSLSLSLTHTHTHTHTQRTESPHRIPTPTLKNLNAKYVPYILLDKVTQ
jgi:hypothetical protein